MQVQVQFARFVSLSFKKTQQIKGIAKWILLSPLDHIKKRKKNVGKNIHQSLRQKYHIFKMFYILTSSPIPVQGHWDSKSLDESTYSPSTNAVSDKIYTSEKRAYKM